MPYGSVVPLAIFTLLFRASKWNVFPVSFLPPTAADLLNYWTIKYFTLNKTNWKTFPCFMRNFPCGGKPDVSINYHRKRGKRERVFFDFPLLASQDIAKTNFYLRRLRVWLSLLRFLLAVKSMLFFDFPDIILKNHFEYLIFGRAVFVALCEWVREWLCPNTNYKRGENIVKS